VSGVNPTTTDFDGQTPPYQDGHIVLPTSKGQAVAIGTKYIGIVNSEHVYALRVDAVVSASAAGAVAGSTYYQARAAGPGYAAYDIIQLTVITIGAATSTVWHNATSGTQNIAPPLIANLRVIPDPSGLEVATSYQNITTAVAGPIALSIPAGTTRINVAIESGTIRVRSDGTAPTALLGQRFQSGGSFPVAGKNCPQLKLYSVTASTVAVEYLS
jgi:hypothetical protein